MASGDEDKVLRQLVQNLRSDLSLLSNEAKKKYPAVKEAAERGAMKLKSVSEAPGFSLEVLGGMDDVVYPLLYACDSKNPKIVQIALSSLQRLIPNGAIPEKNLESTVAALQALVDAGVEELRVIQTVFLMASVATFIKGKVLVKILVLCFGLYKSRDANVHSTAGVAIRQITVALFDKLSRQLSTERNRQVQEGEDVQELPAGVTDAYLLFQDVCFLTNGDPPAWLPNSLEIDVNFGLELLEVVLRQYPTIFMKERLFSLLLTERVCPLVIKLFSPSSKYRLSSVPAGAPAMDKPTFGLSVRLLRILNILIRDFFSSLVTQCEIFLSMLVRFLDSDKPMWQRTLAIEIFHSFCNQPQLFKLFCESYDMQEHSSKIFGDIINALGAFIQSILTSNPATQFPFTVTGATAPGAGGGVAPVPIAVVTGDRPMHVFVVKGITVQAESLPPNAHQKPTYLEMLDKAEVPTIPDGYPLVVGMTAILDAVGSVASVVNDDSTLPSSGKPGKGVKETMLLSSWSGALVAITHLLDTCGDEDTVQMILDAHQTCIKMCGFLKMDAARDAYLLALCKASLPSRYATSLVPSKSYKAPVEVAENDLSPAPPPPRSNTFSDKRPSEMSLRKKAIDAGGGGGGGGGEGAEGSGSSPQVIRSMGAGSGALVAGAGAGSGVSGAPLQQSNHGQQLTAKNLQCIKTLLQFIEMNGGVVGTAWLLVMTTVQHLLHLFGVSPVSAEVVQSSRLDSQALSAVTAEKKSEVADITEKLVVVNIFKSSKQLSDDGLMCLLSALCVLSEQAVLNTANKDAELFPLSSLGVIGENNLHRLKLVWSPIVDHLCKVCMCSDSTFRTFASEGLTILIKKALEYTSKADQKKTDEQKADFHMMLIAPLQVLSGVPHNDVRQKQLDCVGQVLQSRPQALQSSWNVVLGVVSAAANLPSDVLVRSGFQSLQIIITDFLPTIPTICVPTCVEVAGYYGLQAQDINVSLTSIGLLWSIADYLFQNKTKVQDNLEALKEANKLPQAPAVSAVHRQSSQSGSPVIQSPVHKGWRNASLAVFDSVWMFLFRQLADLCVDERAAVRKSASQTLFSTISAHGTLLRQETWHAVLSQILFPLLDQVSMNTDSASTSSLQTQALLIHHSRDTARKQWAETEVLTLNGVARLFQTRWPTLVCLEGFDKAWGTLLEFIKSCAQSLSNEVSEAALKSFHTILVAPPPLRVRSTSVVKSSPPPADQGSVQDDTPITASPASEYVLWEKAWKAWHMIGIECVCRRLPSMEKFKVFLNRTPQTKEESDNFFSTVPSQGVLIYLVQLFPAIYAQVKSKFTQNDFQEAVKILYTALIMPVSKDTSPFLVPSHNEHMMSSLQKDVLKSLASLFTKEEIFDHEDGGPQTLFGKKTELVDTKRRLEVIGEQPLFSLVVAELLKYGNLVASPPDMVAVYQGIPRPPIMTVNYVPFCVSATGLVVLLYCSCIEGKTVVIPPSLSVDCLKAFHVPLKLKYRCVQPVVWMYSLEALLAILKSTLPQVLSQGDTYLPFWNELALILEDFLFNDIPDGMELPMEKSSEYETHDIKLVEMIKRDILPTSTRAPKDFLEKLTAVLNRGSIHSIADHYEDTTVSARVPFRERFARSCFEALLQFSFLHSQDSNIDPTSQLALNALLERCKEVLAKFVHEERLSGQCPLPRSRMNEVSLVLKSVSVLISSLKEAQKSSAKVDKSIWKQVVLLYPALVQCVTCYSMEVRLALKEVLGQFSELIKP